MCGSNVLTFPMVSAAWPGTDLSATWACSVDAAPWVQQRWATIKR